MTTESRMREALEYVASYLESVRDEPPNDNQKFPATIARMGLNRCIRLAREALSPPARRTQARFGSEAMTDGLGGSPQVSPVWFLVQSKKAVKLQPETRLYLETRPARPERSLR